MRTFVNRYCEAILQILRVKINMLAARQGNSSNAQPTVVNNADHLTCNKYGNTLQHTAESGDCDNANLLLEEGNEINAVNCNLETQIYMPVYSNNWETMKILLDHGADHMACDSDG